MNKFRSDYECVHRNLEMSQMIVEMGMIWGHRRASRQFSLGPLIIYSGFHMLRKNALRTDRRNDGPTDQKMNRPSVSYSDARTHLIIFPPPLRLDYHLFPNSQSSFWVFWENALWTDGPTDGLTYRQTNQLTGRPFLLNNSPSLVWTG